MDYDERYSADPAVFGEGEEPILARFVDLLEPEATVLDIGAGQGRNSRDLLERGFTVHALEPSAVAVGQLSTLARRVGQRFSVFATGFPDFVPPVDAYGGILIFGLLPDLDRPAIAGLLERIRDWSHPGTLVWITGFTTEDSGCSIRRASWEHLGEESYRGPGGQVRTYLRSGEILKLFTGFRVLHHWEGLGPEHRHGDSPPERHGWFEGVFQRWD